MRQIEAYLSKYVMSESFGRESPHYTTSGVLSASLHGAVLCSVDVTCSETSADGAKHKFCWL